MLQIKLGYYGCKSSNDKTDFTKNDLKKNDTHPIFFKDTHRKNYPKIKLKCLWKVWI